MCTVRESNGACITPFGDLNTKIQCVFAHVLVQCCALRMERNECSQSEVKGSVTQRCCSTQMYCTFFFSVQFPKRGDAGPIGFSHSTHLDQKIFLVFLI